MFNMNEEKEENVLEKYGRDITQYVKDGKVDPVIGRDDEIRSITRILSRKTKNNPVLIGEPGVGKTAIIEGLAGRIIKGDVPSSLKDKTIWELDMAALIAGVSVNKDYPKNVFGNELSLKPLELCRKRFTHYCETQGLKEYDEKFWKVHLHQGNALNPDCLNKEYFVESYRYDPVKDKVTTDIKKKFTLNGRMK